MRSRLWEELGVMIGGVYMEGGKNFKYFVCEMDKYGSKDKLKV